MSEPVHTSTDCRSEEGITVGLIDALISISRVLAPRLKIPIDYPSAISESLADLGSDKDFEKILIILNL